MNVVRGGFFALMIIAVSGCTSIPSKWHAEGPPNQQVQVKAIETVGTEFSYRDAHVGVSDPIIVSFSTVGPSEREMLPKSLSAPSLRLAGAQLSYLNPDINRTIQDAININADPTTMSNEVWNRIKDQYPALTHLALTAFNVSEEWKLSQEAHRLPYRWSASIVARTVIVDLRTLTVVSEWRQEVADRSTWTDACTTPEEMARYLVPVQTAK